MLLAILWYLNQGGQWLHQLTFGELGPLLDPDIQVKVFDYLEGTWCLKKKQKKYKDTC